jgi:glycosidase
LTESCTDTPVTPQQDLSDHAAIRLPCTPAAVVTLCVALLAAAALATAPPIRAQEGPEAGAGVTYEIFVQSFADSDGDGIGDFAGLTAKLDYVENLGAEAIWLMPIQPSPSYHKYDVTDYRAVHPDYGTMAEFKNFVEAAHARGIEVIIDLVLNHTARAHPWFQRAMENPDGPYRDYYVWATPEEVESGAAEGRGGALRPGEWHDAPGPEDYYGFFWQGMPDLNFDNPEVRQELIDIGRFWLEEVGVDGFRLDAAKHVYPAGRAEDSHDWWAQFRRAMEKVAPDVRLIGEVWGTTKEATPYFEGLDALFNFDLSFAMQEALQTGEADSLAILHEEIRATYRRATDRFSDATFLTNHDQNRLRSVLGGSMKKAEMGASLLFTLPGDPFVYYGQELGMLGKKPDPHIREPMLWKNGPASREAEWIDPVFSTDQTVSPVQVQRGADGSLLSHYRELIALREAHPALAAGRIEAVSTGHESISAFVRTTEGEELLVVHNVASQGVEITLPERRRAFSEPVWMQAGTRNAYRGNSALGRGDEAGQATPATSENGRLHMPGLSTIVLKRP